MGKIMYGGRTYSEEVIPNPMGLPDADLNTIQIGDEIYKISGGGGGGGSDAYSQTLLWDYVDDNSGTVPFGTYSVTLHDDISKYDQLIVENVSSSGDVSDVNWNSTTQYVIDVNALYNAYNPNYYLYTSFGERASRFHIVGTTFEKTTDNNSSIINGLVRVYGVKYIGGGGGGDPYVDDIIWQSEGTTGVSGTVTVQTTAPLSDYDAAYTVQSTSTDGGYSDRFSTVICNVFKDETATKPVRVVQYPSYGNRYTILNSDFDNTEMQIQTGVYGESSGYTPIIYEVHGIKFGSGGGGGTGDADFVELTQAEYDELSYEEKHDPNKMYMISDTPDLVGEYFNPVIYSIEEREIGVWIDGKPLYQKTVDCGALTHGTVKTFSISDLNIDNCVKCSGFAIDPINGWIISINDVTPGDVNGSFRTYVNVSNGNLYIEPGTGTGDTYTKSWITIQYTKTTDVAGSGSYAELGVPAVHYDDMERVIGTWFGDTLYQKTLYDAGGKSGSFSINHGITNLKAVVGYSGCVTDVTYPLTLPRIAYDGNNVGVQSASTTQIVICNPSAFGTRLIDWYVTLQYTKTT